MSNLSRKVWEGTAQFLLTLAILIFLPAWNLFYLRGWLFVVCITVAIIFINLYFLKNDPKLLASRLKAGPANEKEKSQKIIQSFASLFIVVLLIFSVLDYRFAWGSIPFFMSLIGDSVLLVGFYIVFVTFKTNSFTSATIETKKEQTVISSGLYAYVRHPMYFGSVFAFIGIPLALGSFWGLLFVIPLVIVLIIRLLNEEKFLGKNLKGYKEYMQKTKFRLFPFVW